MRRGSSVFITMVALAVGACGPRPGITPGTVQLVTFPPPPDTARIQFLTRISSSADVSLGGPSFWQRLAGQRPEADKAIRKPYGIATYHGRIYVCDTAARAVEVIDLQRRTFDYVGPRGQEALQTPVNCFVDRKGELYVADPGRGDIVILSDSGQYAGRLSLDKGKPGDVFVTDDRIWVTDLASATVRVYDKATRKPLFSFPQAARGAPEALVAPVNLHVTADRVYVSDVFGAKVKVYTTEGKYLRSVGGHGDGLGQFARPKGIAVDRDEHLYVVDAAFENVQMFDDQGRLLMFFGGPYRQPGDMSLPAGIAIDYDNLAYFQKYVHPGFTLKYLILVTNQYGPDKISVYGFVGPTGRPSVGQK